MKAAERWNLEGGLKCIEEEVKKEMAVWQIIVFLSGDSFWQCWQGHAIIWNILKMPGARRQNSKKIKNGRLERIFKNKEGESKFHGRI